MPKMIQIRSVAVAVLLLGVFARLPIVRHAHGPLLSRVWELRPTVTAYDAAYVALAEAFGATPPTADARPARAPGLRARVGVVRGAPAPRCLTRSA